MQGRLTEKGGFFPQVFPAEKWEKEFSIGHDIGFECVEWMFNYDNYKSNPIFRTEKLTDIMASITDNKMKVSGVCCNYFMNKSIFEKGDLKSNYDVVNQISFAAEKIGCKNVVIPLFGASEILEQTDFEIVKSIVCDSTQANILFETDVPMNIIADKISTIGKSNIGVCYDLGNATGSGKDVVKEIIEFGELIFNVHIKDKKLGGSTVLLGEGDAKFIACFEALKQVRYDGPLILESYYVDAIKDTTANYEYIKGLMTR